MGEEYDGFFLDFDIPRVKEGIVEGIDEWWHVLQRIASDFCLIEDYVQKHFFILPLLYLRPLTNPLGESVDED